MADVEVEAGFEVLEVEREVEDVEDGGVTEMAGRWGRRRCSRRERRPHGAATPAVKAAAAGRVRRGIARLSTSCGCSSCWNFRGTRYDIVLRLLAGLSGNCMVEGLGSVAYDLGRLDVAVDAVGEEAAHGGAGRGSGGGCGGHPVGDAEHLRGGACRSQCVGRSRPMK